MVMDHWNNNTCVGKYLKTIYDNRIDKDRNNFNKQSFSQYSKSYGGQFHFDLTGLEHKKILGMDGFGGQQIIIDFDRGRIIVINSLDRHYNWKKIVHKKLKQKYEFMPMEHFQFKPITPYKSEKTQYITS